MVDINVVVKASSENLNKIQVFPTPESPISRSLNNRSYVFFAIFVYIFDFDVSNPKSGVEVDMFILFHKTICYVLCPCIRMNNLRTFAVHCVNGPLALNNIYCFRLLSLSTPPKSLD